MFMQADAPPDKPAVAQTGVTEAPAEPNTGALSLSGGVDWTTAYFFRGYNQEDTGLIFQPWLTLSTSIVENDDYTVSAYIATWNSFHENKTFASGTGPSTWYESDIFGGVDVAFGNWTVGAVYTFYTYPNGAFDTIQEIGFKVAYDDAECWEKAGFDNFALSPYVGVYIETSDGNGSEDVYAEVGIAPSFDVGNDITIAIPVRLGLSLDDYYLDSDGDNETFGYGSIGVFASMPLPFGERYGAWTLTGGVEYLNLFANSARVANDGGTSYELLGKVGISFAY